MAEFIAKIKAELDTGEVEKQIENIGKGKKIKVNVDVSGAKTVDGLSEGIEKANRSAKNLDNTFKSISTAKLKYDAFRMIEQQCKNAVSAVKELNDAMTLVSMTMLDMPDSTLNSLATQSLDMAKELSAYSKTVTDAVTIYANANESVNSILEKSQPTVLLASASGMSASKAADSIQGILNQFDMADDKAMHVADSIEKLSSEIALDFSKGIGTISEAVANSGALANEAGLSFEKYGAIVSATAESTRQSGSVLGNAYKTIFSRITRSKTGEASDADKAAAEKALNSIGVNIRDENGEFLDLSVTLDALNKKWSTLTEKQRSYIGEAVAGIRQKNIFVQTMNTYNRALELEQKALDSEGTAMKINEKRVDSIDGKMQKLSATMTKLYTDAVPDDAAKGMLDFATAVAEVADKFNLLQGAIATAGVIGMSNMVGKIATNWGSIVAMLSNPATLFATGIGVAVSAFSAYQKSVAEMIESARQAGDAWESSNDSIQSQIDKIIELRTELDSGTLTEEESYVAKSNLLDIQNQLSESYGNQVSGIALVNGSLEEQIELLNRLSQAEANKFLNEKRSGIAEAEKQMAKNRHTVLGQFDIGMEDEDSVRRLDAILAKYADRGISAINDNGMVQIQFDGDATLAAEVLNDFMTDVRQASDETGDINFFETFSKSAEDGLADANNILKDHKELIEQAAQARLVANTELFDANGKSKTAADWIRDYAKAVQAYNDALATGDSSKIAVAADEFAKMDSVINGLVVNTGMGEFSEQINEVRSGLNEAAIATVAFIDALSGENVSGNTSLENIYKQAEILKDLALTDVDFKYALSTDGLQDSETHMLDIVAAAKEIGFVSDSSSESINKIADALLKAGIISGQTAEEMLGATENIEEAEDAAATFSESMKEAITTQESLNAAISESNSTTGLSAEQIESITDAYKDLDGYDPSTLFRETASGVRLNMREMELLNEQLEENTRKDFLGKIRDKQNELNDAIRNGASDELISDLQSQLSALQLLSNSYDGATSRFKKWVDAMNSANAGDNVRSAVDMNEKAQKLYDEGRTNTDDFRAAANYYSYGDLSGATQAQMESAWEASATARDRYFTGTKDGIDNFMRDMMQANEEGGFNWIEETEDGMMKFNTDADEAIAKHFNLSKEAVQDLFKLASEYNDSIVVGDTSGVDFSNIDELESKAQSAKTTLQEIGNTDLNLDFDYDNATVNELQDQLSALEEEKQVRIEGDGKGVEEIDTLIERCQAGIDALNVASISPNVSVNDMRSAFASVDRIHEIIAQIQGENPIITVKGVVEGNEEIQTLAQEIASLPPEVQTYVGIETENVGNVQGILSQLSSNPESINVPVNYTKGSEPEEVNDATGVANFTLGESPKEVPDATGTANFTLGAYPTFLPSITQTVIRNVVESGVGEAQGTPMSRANGTPIIKSSRLNDGYLGTLISGGARVKGTWGEPKDTVALTGEEDRELVVRGNHFFTVGDNGPEMARLKRGDIVFNARQTKDILSKGYTTGRGRALATGNARSSGTWEFGGRGTSSTQSSSGTTVVNNYTTNNYNNTSQKKTSSVSSKGNGGDKDSIDWIEVKLDRIERKIKHLKNTADDAYKTFSVRNKALDGEISEVTSEIETQEKAYDRYIAEADSVKLKSSLKKKVRNGTIDINKYSDKTKEKIEEYKQWYEKALDCKDAISDLNVELTELYRQQFDNIITKWTNALQNLEHAAERTDSIISRRSDYAGDYVSRDNKESASYSNITDYQGLVNNAKSQIDKKASELVELRRKLNEAVADSAKTGIYEGSEGYYEMLAEIQDVEKEIDSLNSDIISYSNSISEAYMDIFDNIAQGYEDKLELAGHLANEYNNSLEMAEAKGYIATEKYYEMLKGVTADNITVMKQEQEELTGALLRALSSGEIQMGSKAWADMKKQINDVTESISEAELEMEEFNQTIRETKWEQFDYLEERISRVSDEVKFFTELMSNKKLFDDKGKFTAEGTATLGMYGLNYNVLMKQADDYAAEILKINKELEENPYNTDIIARKEELLELQQQSILAAEDEKNAILSLVRDGIEQELSSLKDLIDSYADALDSQKDLYDYQKRVAQQAENIASLQKQLSAYENDISEETKAKIQKIKVELESAKEDLEETQYEKYISDQKKLLDDLYNEYERTLNERLDNLDALVMEVIDYINQNAAFIDGTLKSEAEKVGYTMSDTMSSIWGQASAAFNADAAQRVKDVASIVTELANNGRISEEKANEILTALGEGKAQDVQNTLELLARMGANGVMSPEDIALLNEALTNSTTPTNNTLSMYSSDFNDKATTANMALKGIEAYVNALAKQAEAEALAAQKKIQEEEAARKAAEQAAAQQGNKNPQNTKPAAQEATTNKVTDKAQAEGNKNQTPAPAAPVPATPAKEPAKTNSTQGDGKIQVGDKVTFKKGSYYNSSDGMSPKGSQKLGKTVYITKINKASWATHPYHISTGKKLGSGDLGWLKKSQISGYAKGAKRVTDEFAWTNENWDKNGGETILRKSDNAILTNLKDARIFNAMSSENIWQMANNPYDFVQKYSAGTRAMINALPSVNSTSSVDIGDVTINLPNVTNFEEFRDGMMDYMQKSKGFENFIQSITVDRMLGKSRTGKYRFKL